MNADTSIWPHQIESRLQRQASLYHNTTYHLGLLLKHSMCLQVGLREPVKYYLVDFSICFFVFVWGYPPSPNY